MHVIAVPREISDRSAARYSTIHVTNDRFLVDERNRTQRRAQRAQRDVLWALSNATRMHEPSRQAKSTTLEAIVAVLRHRRDCCRASCRRADAARERLRVP